MAVIGVLSVVGAFALSCAKDPLLFDRNRPPQTFLVGAPIDTTVDEAQNYSYRIHLHWRGEDSDGYVVGFEYSWDDSSITAFRFTTKTDSIFELTVNDSSLIGGGGTTNPGNSMAHTFYVRAVDNLGKSDPSLSMFNSRTFRAGTESPIVTFVGAIPNLTDLAEIDTLCDRTPFSICWQGRDPDGTVFRYRFSAGSYESPLSTDSCAYFNDPSRPNSVPLVSGLYTITAVAVDNANAIGKNTVQVVVNRDPETWFLPKGAPIGHYIQHSLFGQPVNIQGTFAPGDTVPFRSTVWWEWDGEDLQEGHGDCEPDWHPTPNPAGCMAGWSFVLQPGARNDGSPYIIGFLDTLATTPTLIRFNTNDPGPLNLAGFTALILDSLDAGTDLIATVASRDCSNRKDGTGASFVFHCNFPPKITANPTVRDTLANPEGLITGNEPCQLIEWTSEDFEDGPAWGADVKLDDTRTIQVREPPQAQSVIVPNRVFLVLSPGPTHTVTVRPIDRAGIYAPLPDGARSVSFVLP